MVFYAPILLYYAAHGGKGKVQVIGSIFRKESYAVALPNDSPYRKPINKEQGLKSPPQGGELFLGWGFRPHPKNLAINYQLSTIN